MFLMINNIQEDPRKNNSIESGLEKTMMIS